MRKTGQELFVRYQLYELIVTVDDCTQNIRWPASSAAWTHTRDWIFFWFPLVIHIQLILPPSVYIYIYKYTSLLRVVICSMKRLQLLPLLRAFFSVASFMRSSPVWLDLKLGSLIKLNQLGISISTTAYLQLSRFPPLCLPLLCQLPHLLMCEHCPLFPCSKRLLPFASQLFFLSTLFLFNLRLSLFHCRFLFFFFLKRKWWEIHVLSVFEKSIYASYTDNAIYLPHLFWFANVFVRALPPIRFMFTLIFQLTIEEKV